MGPIEKFFFFFNALLKAFPYQFQPLYLGKQGGKCICNKWRQQTTKCGQIHKSSCLAKQFLWLQELESITVDFPIAMSAESHLLELELGNKYLHWAERVRRKDPFDQKWLHFTDCYAIILCLKISGLGGAKLQRSPETQLSN